MSGPTVYTGGGTRNVTFTVTTQALLKSDQKITCIGSNSELETVRAVCSDGASMLERDLSVYGHSLHPDGTRTERTIANTSAYSLHAHRRTRQRPPDFRCRRVRRHPQRHSRGKAAALPSPSAPTSYDASFSMSTGHCHARSPRRPETPSAATPWTTSTIERDRCGTARVQTCNIRGCIEANLVGTFDYRRAQVAAITPVSRGVTISSSTVLSSQRTMPISKLDWIDLRPMIPTGACELFTIITLLGAVDIVHQPARQGVEEELEGALRTVQEGFAVSCHAIEMASPCSAAASLLRVSGGDRPFQVLRRTGLPVQCDGGFQQATRTTGRVFPPAMLARRCAYSVRGQGAPVTPRGRP